MKRLYDLRPRGALAFKVSMLTLYMLRTGHVQCESPPPPGTTPPPTFQAATAPAAAANPYCLSTMCETPTCAREFQICTATNAGCLCCKCSVPKLPPDPPRPSPRPSLICPQFLTCVSTCAAGQESFCFEPRPPGCPCCVGCRARPSPPPAVPNLDPPPPQPAPQRMSGKKL